MERNGTFIIIEFDINIICKKKKKINKVIKTNKSFAISQKKKIQIYNKLFKIINEITEVNKISLLS